MLAIHESLLGALVVYIFARTGGKNATEFIFVEQIAFCHRPFKNVEMSVCVSMYAPENITKHNTCTAGLCRFFSVTHKEMGEYEHKMHESERRKESKREKKEFI